MARTAAHLVDRVLPDVPVRQWVLSESQLGGEVAARLYSLASSCKLNDMD